MDNKDRRKRLMTPDPAAPDETRRRLLTGGALTVAASAAVLGRADADDAAAPEQPDRGKLEYRVTDHIAAYYARARG
jgi:hypothetical protein